MQSKKDAVRVLPADVFDALELSALAFGGIGKWSCWSGEDVPNCIHGHAVSCDPTQFEMGEPRRALYTVGIDMSTNDAGLFDVMGGSRVPFAEWCQRLNVVRDDSPTFDPSNFVDSLESRKGGKE